jgi:ABC-type multidrug transport system ATPase subunit
MLRCEKLSVRAGDKGPLLLDQVSAAFPARGMNALVGPSGCGKTTLAKALLRLIPAEGKVYLDEMPIGAPEQLLGRVGFAPQFSIAHPHLSVEESLRFILRLTVARAPERKQRLEEILRATGLEAHRDKRVGTLSGGQLRRLGLGLEFSGDPPLLFCDEVTTGLDPNSEDQILALLRRLCEERATAFVNIIHNLGKLGAFDTVTVLYGGGLVFQGTPEELLDYFGIGDFLHLYDALDHQPAAHWRERWEAHRAEASNQGGGAAVSVAPAEAPPPVASACERGEPARRIPPGPAQLLTLLHRRFLLFFRDKGYLGLTAAITFGFPCIVVIFALGGLGQLESPPLQPTGNPLERNLETLQYRIDAARTGQLATGLILFQVILLTLMGSNNGAREIAAERHLFEKERLMGVSPGAYAACKILFTACLALFQGCWMTWFVKTLCYFPGAWTLQLGVLSLCAVAMTQLSLGLSALFRSPDRASLLSIYFVGFQLPLSGIVLALPEALVWVFRPFINAYWSWAGYVGAFRKDRLFDALSVHRDEAIPQAEVALAVLLAHTIVGIGLVFAGTYRRQRF